MSSSTYIELPQNGGGGTAGVDSFNGRTGTVTSQSGDYNAGQISYDNSTSGIPPVNVQAALDYLAEQSATSASPGFSFGRAGVVNAGTYLQCETVPSNVAGRWVYINSATIDRVYIANENTGPFIVEVLYHQGNGLNLTSLGTVTVTGTNGGVFTVNWSVPTNRQLAVKIYDSSLNPAKNIVCGLELSGSR